MKKTLLLVFLFLTSFRVFSQTPDTLFFDDFARYKNRLDTLKWEPRSTVYVNDHYSKNPVSKNIATFNGVSSTGQLSQSNVLSNAGVDTLTSRPLNTANYTISDSVYLKFYLQTGGIGDAPVPSTSRPAYFEVEFKDANGNWVQVSRINPPPFSQRTLAFKPYAFALNGAQFFHANFQFRFRSFGNKRISQDTWNLDYITLVAQYRKSRSGFDVMTSRRVSSLLERYTAMPIHQFLVNIAGELNDSVFTTLNNYENQPRGISTTSSIQIGNNAPLPFATHQIPIQPNFLQYDLFPDKPAASIFAGLSGFQTIKSSVFVNSRENPSSETVLNDTISRTTLLHDFYAYDDGSAESVISVLFGQGAQVGQVAQQFYLNQDDRVKSIMVYLPKYGNTKNTRVTFKLWNVDSNGIPATPEIFSTVFVVPDLAQLNNWFVIPVDPSVRVSNSFFAGWSITATQPFFSLGLDLNQNTPVRFNDFATNWITENEGTLMLRVALNNNITGLGETVGPMAAKTRLYPNPASDFVMLEGDFEHVKLMTSTGQVLLEKRAASPGLRLDTRHLKPGFYLVQLQKAGRIETHKLIIQPN